MKQYQYTFNETGKQEIKKFLSDNHKLGRDHFNDQMLDAWEQEEEFQLGEGNPATIEIRSFDSILGVTKEYRISDDGIDKEEIEIDE